MMMNPQILDQPNVLIWFVFSSQCSKSLSTCLLLQNVSKYSEKQKEQKEEERVRLGIVFIQRLSLYNLWFWSNSSFLVSVDEELMNTFLQVEGVIAMDD